MSRYATTMWVSAQVHCVRLLVLYRQLPAGPEISAPRKIKYRAPLFPAISRAAIVDLTRFRDVTKFAYTFLENAYFYFPTIERLQIIRNIAVRYYFKLQRLATQNSFSAAYIAVGIIKIFTK